MSVVISELLGEPIEKYSPISGGDISTAFLLYTANNRFFLKTKRGENALKMFETERLGLDAIACTNSVRAPRVYFAKQVGVEAFLLMEYIESKKPGPKDFKRFGAQLAELHKNTSCEFGWEQDNFIGSLPQSNSKNENWPEFYASERLLPQLKFARSKALLSPSEAPDLEKLCAFLKNLLPDEPPSLLHGDLWGGNYLISSDGLPYLIDPAVYYGHNGVDISMTKLFGGFGSSFYDVYYEVIPANSNEKELTDIYQLYYLLVHLNLFGSSYYNAVVRIFDRYFNQ